MKFLFISAGFPHFDCTSGGLRLYTLIALLQEAGHSCDYFLVTPKAEVSSIGIKDFHRYQNALKNIGVSTLLAAAGDSEVLRAKQYDCILFEFFMCAEKWIDVVRITQPNAKLVIDSVDITYLRWYTKAQNTQEPEDLQYAEAVEKRELTTYGQADLVLTLTQEETKELAGRIPGLPVFEMPNIHEIPSWIRNESTEPSLLFIGSFTHEPNVDAVRFFYADVWPIVRQERPETRWVIVGANAPKDIEQMTGNGVEVAGRVPSTEPYLASCWVSLAPLRFGAGMKGKVGEALAAGIPVVTTSVGAQGYGLVNGKSAVIGDSVEALAGGIIELIEDAEKRRQMGESGHATVARQFSREAVAKRIPLLVETIASVPLRERSNWVLIRRAGLILKEQWARHVAWRLKQLDE